MSLTLTGGPPTFTEVADDELDPGQILTAAILQAINADVNWAAVSCEDFWGYYKNGETVVLPTSAADGYVYGINEVLYTWEIYSTLPPTGSLNGAQTAPTLGSPSGAGSILQMGFNVNQFTGLVNCQVSYYVTNGSETDTTDGVLLVHTLARRLSNGQTLTGYIVGTALAMTLT